MSSSEKLRKRLKLLLRSRSRRRSWTSRMSLNQSAQCSATCRIRAICRGFRSRRGKKSVGTEQPECPMPSRQCQWHREKESTMDYYKKLYQKTITKHMQVLHMCVCLSCISLFGLGAHGKHVPVTHTSILGQCSTAVHPALAAIAARAGFRGTALVLVQEPVHIASSHAIRYLRNAGRSEGVHPPRIHVTVMLLDLEHFAFTGMWPTKNL